MPIHDNEDVGEDYGPDDDDMDARREFADPGGRSALRAASKDNPRIYSCPTCKAPRKLTRKDKELGYQCDSCADRAEQGLDIDY
jgi:DNA-directed RNA polymerase subunit RPC12/RpoP